MVRVAAVDGESVEEGGGAAQMFPSVGRRDAGRHTYAQMSAHTNQQPPLHPLRLPASGLRETKETRGTIEGLRKCCEMVAHLVSVLLPGAVAWVAWQNWSFFAWHPLAMVLAFAFLMNEAVQVFSPASSLVASRGRNFKVNAHGWLLFSTFVLAALGFGVIYWNKAARGAPHFTTWHGLVGGVTLAWTALQTPAGLFLKYAHKVKLPLGLRLVELKVYHSLSGALLFALAAVSLLLGCYSSWFQSGADLYVWGVGAVSSLLLLSVAVSELSTIVNEKAPKILKK